MKIRQTFPLALVALLRNKTRSLLTSLGVVIGVASVISMVSVGEGAKSRVESIFASMGTNMLVVLSGSTSSGGLMGGFGSMPTLTWEDLDAVRQQAPAIKVAAPVLNARVTLVSDEANWTTGVTGTSAEFFEIRSWRIARGAMFSVDESEASARSIVLGQTASDKLFGAGTDPIGRSVRLRSIPFQVIGVLERKGQSPMGSDYDDTAVIPVRTFQTQLQGGLHKFIAGAILVSAHSATDTQRAQSQITGLLRDRHHIGEHDEDDFSIRNLSEIASAQQQGTKALTALLAAIAVVSLLVGGMGIMNIMLVSVSERTREIGVRMAVGAKPQHVLAQFLVEATVLSMAGGCFGVAAGVAVARMVATRFGWAAVLRPDMIVMSFGFSALVGVCFGLYPALRASRLDPIEALRYE